MIINLAHNISVRNQPFLPFYHSVNNQTPNHIKHLYSSKGKQDFKKEVQFFLKHFVPISLKGLIKQEKHKKPVFHISFDDGFVEFYKIVAPILMDYNVSATVFLNSNFVDNKNLFYRCKISLLYNEFLKSRAIKRNFYDFFETNKDESIKQKLFKINFLNQNMLDELADFIGYSFENYLEKEKPYLTSEQIFELIEKGFTFGGHTINHPKLPELGFEQQKYQIIKSIDDVQNNFDLNYRVFSFPFSDHGISHKLMIELKDNIDLSFGIQHFRNSFYSFHKSRINMENYTYFSKKNLIEVYLKSIVKRILKRNQISWI